jgi:hypothetical protein
MRKTFASRAVGLLPFFLVLGPSCSLVYDLSPDQCSTNSDCDHFGPGMVCNSGICACGNKSVCGSGASGGTGGDGTGGVLFGGTGGTDGGTGGTLGGTGGDAGAPPEAGGASAMGGTGGSNGGTGGSGAKGGTSGKGGSGTGNTGNDAGAAGVEQAPECTTHKDCFTLYPDDSDANPRACIEGKCVPLKSEDCPAVLPLSDNGVWNALKSYDAIILGAFAPINGVSLDTIGRNYDLAADELWTEVKGVFAGSSSRHPLVFVVCNNYYDGVQAGLLPPARHLMEDLRVPGVVSALYLQDQRYVWENVAKPNGTFMMMPLYSDQSLIDEPDDGLIWHMLSGANALSVSYQPLVDMTVDHLKMAGALGGAEPVKIAHVEATDEPFLNDTAAYIDENLQFNGQSTSANLNAEPPLYDPISIQSSYSAPTDPQDAAIASILDFKPHIVIGTTVSEMLIKIIPGVESGWDDAAPDQTRPFYILGALDYNDPQMPTLIKNDHSISAGQPALYKRILGLNWPSAVDQSVNQAYQDRWIKKYHSSLPGYENFYDPVYYLMYGVAAAQVPLTGSSIASGMLRVISTATGTPVVDVGPGDDMDTYITALNQSKKQKIELVGAMGPPTWDPYGARNDPASVWCVNPLGTYYPDQLRYDAGPPGTLTGKVDPSTCFTFDGLQ